MAPLPVHPSPPAGERPGAGAARPEIIAAIATARGAAGLGVVRLSGAGALDVARSRLQGLPSSLEPRRLHRARLLDAAGEPLDEVLVVQFPAPRSYTGEEVVEIQGHGGSALLDAALAAILSAGARLARPGEFTQRAVHGGRLDLLEAEALAALLEADDEAALATARKAARESLPALRSLRGRAVDAFAEAQGTADHPLETAGHGTAWREVCAALALETKRLQGTHAFERADLEGARVVLLGPPNAGKSSLLNALVAEERSLVDAAPGTTRDLVTAPLRLAGKRVTLCDTAGLRSAAGLEAAGVGRAVEAARGADVVLWVEDVSAPPAQPPDEIAVAIRVLAKADLPPHSSRLPLAGETISPLPVSARAKSGITELRGAIEARLPQASAAVSDRQRQLLREAERALGSAADLPGEDLAIAALGQAVEVLDRLCGVGAGREEAEARIFARFCIGK